MAVFCITTRSMLNPMTRFYIDVITSYLPKPSGDGMHINPQGNIAFFSMSEKHMNMKSKILSTALFAAIGVASFGAQAADPWVDLELQGLVTKSTCTMSANGGATTVDVGVLKTSDFLTAGVLPTRAGVIVGNKVPVKITLEDCVAAETGDLIIKGTTNTTYPEVFVRTQADQVGFIIEDAAGDNMTNLTPTADTTGVAVAATPGTTDYEFKVGMASTITTALSGSKPSAPVKIVYYVQ